VLDLFQVLKAAFIAPARGVLNNTTLNKWYIIGVYVERGLNL
jgi:hypothetical protein